MGAERSGLRADLIAEVAPIGRATRAVVILGCTPFTAAGNSGGRPAVPRLTLESETTAARTPRAAKEIISPAATASPRLVRL